MEHPPKKEDHSASFIRHSKSGYETYAKILSSDSPNAPFNHTEQVTPDLTESGVELARTEAEKFFSELNPAETALFFVSSNEARAIETANIYRQAAKGRGFEILVPENTRSALAENIGEGEIRVVDNLSINSQDLVIDNVFQTPKKRSAVNWGRVDPEIRRRFEEATKIIEADDQGNFGPNFAKHSEAVKKIFPEIKTAEELYEKQFKNLIRLFEFGMKKAGESEMSKRLKIVAFGHENYMAHALEKYFADHEISNCEAVVIEAEGDSVAIERRGEKSVVN